MKDHTITRRTFLQTTGVAAVAAAGFPAWGSGGEESKVRVVLIRDKNVLDVTRKVDGKILERMLDEAMVKLFAVKDPEKAWNKIITPSDIVGVKTNVWKNLRTPVVLEDAIRARIMAAGVAEENVSIDDRGILSNPVFQKATALINVRPLRAHHWSGVGGCLKNYIMFTPHPPDYHPDSCVDLGGLWNLPRVKGKTRLNILVMLTPQFHCLGPHHFDRDYTWPYCGLLVGTDPVALDAVGVRIFEAQRRLFFKEDSPIRPPTKHIQAAQEKHGVGIADLERIEIVRLGWGEGILI
jgi:hypothetical protein